MVVVVTSESGAFGGDGARRVDVVTLTTTGAPAVFAKGDRREAASEDV